MMRTQGVRTIDKVLAMLENSRGDFVSGAEMASGLGISRNAIWKAIKELKVQGYSIESVTNKGYRLSKDNDIISAEGIKSFINPDSICASSKLFVYDSIDSTNDKAKELAFRGADHGTCIVATKQDGGRGRRDHLFFSPEGGIYMSVILMPDKIPFTRNVLITQYIGISVCETIKELTGICPYIQGINDLYVNDRKICGILIESGSEFDSDTLQWIVVGIGINFDPDIKEFPVELQDIVTSLFKPGEGTISKNELIARILEKVCQIEKADESSVQNRLSTYRR